MNDIEALRNEILPKTKVFYDSIVSQFIYREKHFSKFRALNIATGISLFIFIITIVPIVPYFSGEWKWLLNQQVTIGSLTVPLDNFFFRWIFFTISVGILYLILRPT